jgi:short-subunit dehydrogenase involved in D-alanine esterification of teichoic acids
MIDKTLILGNGFVGTKLAAEFMHAKKNVLLTDKNILDFDSKKSYATLFEIIKHSQSNLIINSVGILDESFDSFESNFWSNCFPSWCLYEISKTFADEAKDLKIILISSSAAGQPRLQYPLYAATKGSEIDLFKTAVERFEGTSVSWSVITLPALDGGLRKRVRFPENRSNKILSDLMQKIYFTVNSVKHGDNVNFAGTEENYIYPNYRVVID